MSTPGKGKRIGGKGGCPACRKRRMSPLDFLVFNRSPLLIECSRQKIQVAVADEKCVRLGTCVSTVAVLGIHIHVANPAIFVHATSDNERLLRISLVGFP